ncbi:nitrate ABC transporter substrate-binding protein [Burkholderia sp. Bp9131]|uniref:nitrate ABC transporter substrate-binding protein n=1 Tax=Burkholderia sp. Bp9131 TaxID=2184571 RepID=UPI000F5877C0|nr:nitrate ABC transporter substrate-binding protein [Burkholderia sp. Bp9131]RQR43468.1 nitrate ABC transporter substrate-binding protein [Burkholderia sp. Bp9131]
MRPIIKLAVRDWDHLVPLSLGDLKSSDFDLQIERVSTLPNNIAADGKYDVAEMSFSRYARLREAGDDSIVGVPHFIMRAFRHRCIVTSSDSTLNTIEQLAGKKIGMTGWSDSGNTWTRAILRRANIGINDAHWYVGRLTDQHDIADRLNGYGVPGRIEAIAGDRSLVDSLLSGDLDAAFTPFMPSGFFHPDSGLRQLLPNSRELELAYFNEVGFVPGIHILAVRRAVVEEYPWLPKAMSQLFDASAEMWQQKREKYADTTPWIIDELRAVSRDLPSTWNKNGLAANRPMIEAFANELVAQRILRRVVTPDELFADAAVRY